MLLSLACMSETFFDTQHYDDMLILRLQSQDGTNRLTRACVVALINSVGELRKSRKALVIAGNQSFFSAGAELEEIAALSGPEAYEFAMLGQTLMAEIESFSAPVYAAISGYCMGGGLDLVLACHRRIAAPNAVFGHRGAALGLITGWGGTQRLPRLIGKSQALAMFIAAEIVNAENALSIGLVDAIAEDPLTEALSRIRRQSRSGTNPALT